MVEEVQQGSVLVGTFVKPLRAVSLSGRLCLSGWLMPLRFSKS